MNIYQHALLKLFIVISFPEHFDVCAAKAKRPKPIETGQSMKCSPEIKA